MQITLNLEVSAERLDEVSDAICLLLIEHGISIENIRDLYEDES